MVAYNLVKYYLILLKKFNVSLMNCANFSKKYSKEKDMAWKNFWNHPDYHNKRNDYAKKQAAAEAKFQDLHNKCSYKLEEIKKLNEYF